MTIENESGLTLFNRLVKSILALQQIHGYKLCKDFQEGVRIIGDELLAVEVKKFDAIRPPLNISIKKSRFDRFYRYRNHILTFGLIAWVLSIFYLGVLFAPYFEEPTAVPIITMEEFTEMAEKCEK